MGSTFKKFHDIANQPLGELEWLGTNIRDVGGNLLKGDFGEAWDEFKGSFGEHNEMMSDLITPILGENKLTENPDAVAGAIMGGILAAPYLAAAGGAGAGAGGGAAGAGTTGFGSAAYGGLGSVSAPASGMGATSGGLGAGAFGGMGSVAAPTGGMGAASGGLGAAGYGTAGTVSAPSAGGAGGFNLQEFLQRFNQNQNFQQQQQQEEQPQMIGQLPQVRVRPYRPLKTY